MPPRRKSQPNKWVFLKHPLFVVVAGAVVTGLIAFAINKLTRLPSPSQNSSQSTTTHIGGNNFGQVAGRDIINPTTIVSASSIQKPSLKWQPPELPSGCSNVVIWLGGEGKIYPTSFIIQSPPAPSSEKRSINDFPPDIKKTIQQLPGFTPRLKEVFGRTEFSYTVNGQLKSFPVVPYINSNQLYVYVEIPFLNDRRKILISDELDSVLTNCLPASWDWNYNSRSNKYEIVNEYGNPIVQVIYKTASEIQVNGVFFGSKYDVYATFDGKRPGLFSFNDVPFQIVVNQHTQTTTIADLQREYTNMNFFLGTNEVYRSFATNQKAIFKYPSNLYPGEFAN